MFFHFSWLYYCPTTESLICGDCTPPTFKPIRFWNKTYTYSFWCKDCEESHYDLLYTEFTGMHPWQLEKTKLVSNLKNPELWKPVWGPLSSRKGQEISVEEALKVEDRITPVRKQIWKEQVTRTDLVQQKIEQGDTQKRWEANSKYWLEALEKYLYLNGPLQEMLLARGDDVGDINREFIIDPALWVLIGDVNGLKVLDAGCGNGYFTRELTRKGAKTIGVDFSQTFIDYCKKKEENEKLGCEFIQASLVDLSEINSNEFDLVVSNIVMVDVSD
jgi:2-polyprenyl-3-methyl-5-hydroxy-6-metoxy-1,4-benzoquinol methylase